MTSEKVAVLCVDDEVNVLKALERLFIDDDYEIHTAGSGREGLEILDRGVSVQIVISDYRMPAMNGVDFLKEVCRRWPETVRIVLSGYADTAAIVSAINEGQIYKFIPKPWNDDELRVTLANAVERYFLHRRNKELMEELKRKNEELEKVNAGLEHIVVERTSKLSLQNKILVMSQNILDSLPVGVVGFDMVGEIVQCNRLAAHLCGQDKDIVGKNRKEVFSAEINAVIGRRPGTDGWISVAGTPVKIRCAHMQEGNQEGMILLLDKEM